MRTIIYVDGFNLYYGCLKNTDYRWLNLGVLFQTVLQGHHNIECIRYFTAKVKSSPRDPTANLRQQAYLKALETLPDLSIHYGHFARNKVRMPKLKPPPNTVEVIKTEEKGSDVNFSVHLLNDAWKDRYDCAVLVTNDSDMGEAMRLVKSQFPEKKLGLITPVSKPVAGLKKYAHFTRVINNAALKSSQFSNPLEGRSKEERSKKLIYKPKSW